MEYDLVTLGAGSGGVRASRFASSKYGAKVAVIELPFGLISSEKVGGAGGTCVIRGCVPKKLLVYGSSFADEFTDAEGFGWEPTNPKFDWNFLIQNKTKEVSRLNSIYGNILKNNGVEQIEGKAYIKDKNTVQVLNPETKEVVRELKTKNILIAVGGGPARLSIPGEEHTITSDEALSLPEQPKRIAIIGAGYIAVEFAGIFAGFGSEVHLFFRKDLPLTKFDGECREMVAENLKTKATLHPGMNPVRIDKQDNEYTLVYKGSDGVESSIVVDAVMMATGRTPRTRALGLENTGVEMNGPVVKVDQYLRTNVPNIWALGDVIGRIELTPVALMEGMTFAANCFGKDGVKEPDYGSVPSAVFCQPPLGTVGLSEEECVAKYSGEMDVFVSKFKPMKNTLSGKQDRTLMKMIVHKETDAVLGVHMVGDDAAEIMQGIGIAIKAGAKKAHFDTTVGIHPSSAEEFVTMRTPTRTVTGTGSETP